MRMCWVLALVLCVGCTPKKTKKEEPPPETQPSRAPTSKEVEGPVSFSGTCAGASAVGEMSKYPLVLKAKETSLGKIRLRSNGRFVVEDTSNVLGDVPAGTVLYGQGPLSNPDYGRSRAYAVALRDFDGKTCRGFVSTQVVDVVGRSPWAGKTNATSPSSVPASASSPASKP
jgi:hypothetical protein